MNLDSWEWTSGVCVSSLRDPPLSHVRIFKGLASHGVTETCTDAILHARGGSTVSTNGPCLRWLQQPRQQARNVARGSAIVTRSLRNLGASHGHSAAPLILRDCPFLGGPRH